MKINFKEILNAWYNVINHTPEQKELADKRFAICLECPSKIEILKDKKWFFKCKECGCPLGAKIYTETTYLTKDKSCPLDKWKEIEMEFMSKNRYAIKYKTKKTFL